MVGVIDSVLVLVTLAGGGRVGPGNVSPVTVNYVSLTPATTLLTTTSIIAAHLQ